MLKTNEIQKQISFKIIIIGEGSVGKSSILQRYIQNTFNVHLIATVGIDFYLKEIVLADQNTIRLQIWDTAGLEKYRSITPNFYNNVQGIILVFDLCQKQTFTNLNVWLNNCNDKLGQNIFRIILANKRDLEEMHEVSEQEIDTYCKKQNLQYFLTSAKTGEKVEDAFLYIANLMYQKHIMNLKSLQSVKPNIIYALEFQPASQNNQIVKKKKLKEDGCC